MNNVSRGQREREKCENAMLLTFKMKERAMNQKMQVSPGAGKVKEIDSPLEFPKEILPCRHLEFRTSGPWNCMIINLWCLSH